MRIRVVSHKNKLVCVKNRESKLLNASFGIIFYISNKKKIIKRRSKLHAYEKLYKYISMWTYEYIDWCCSQWK